MAEGSIWKRLLLKTLICNGGKAVSVSVPSRYVTQLSPELCQR